MSDVPPDRWDPMLAEWLVGKHVLVGITYLKDNSDEVTQHVQFHGIVTSAEMGKTITIECEGAKKGQLFKLPPDTANFGPAAKGIYKLRDTGEEVDSPDAIATWVVSKGKEDIKE
jgi:hypothetical protein